MKIAMLMSCAFPPEEGIGNYVQSLSTKLIERGHDISVITRGGPKSEFLEYKNIHIIKIPFIMAYPFHVDIHGIFVNRFLENFEKQIDLVHVHMPLAPAVHTRLPIVTTFHTPHFADFFSTDLVNFRQYLTKGLEILDYRIEKSLISSSSVIGTVSEGVKRDLEHYYPIGSRTVKVFGNAVSDKLLEAGRPLTTHKDEFMILNVGRLDYRKGLLDLIESMRFVTARVPKARLVLIGKGPMLSEIIKKVIELNLQKQVEIKGFVSSDQVLAAYLRASIFVLPSHYEGLATVSLEAMACRAAVVATDVRGNSEVVKSGHTGLLVPKKDPRALGDAIVYLLQQSDLRERLASSARKLIEENFTWEKVTDRVLEAYSVAMR